MSDLDALRTPADLRHDALRRLGIDRSDVFVYDRVDVDGERVRLHYDLDGVGPLVEEFVLEGLDVESVADRPDVRGALELLHLTAGLSYLKATLPPRLVGAVAEAPDTAALLAALVTDGLAEFAYVNGTDLSGWFDLTAATAHTGLPTWGAPARSPLVPVGGGKDSIVTLEALRPLQPTLFAVNPRGPIVRTMETSGLPTRTVRRRLDASLFDLNDRGALNGHVPVTAIVTAAAVVTAAVAGHDVVALSNERSADQPTLVIEGRAVNHQWSKSSAFEYAFARLVHTRVRPDLDAVSFLRPASELAIAHRFAASDAYDHAFNSCNRAFHLRGTTTEWCGRCPKCRFVHLVLAPFMTPDRLEGIFGRILFDDPEQLEGFAALGAIGGPKPFECVGEEEEARAAMGALLADPAWADRPVLAALADAVPGPHALSSFLAPADPSGLPSALQEPFRAVL